MTVPLMYRANPDRRLRTPYTQCLHVVFRPLETILCQSTDGKTQTDDVGVTHHDGNTRVKAPLLTDHTLSEMKRRTRHTER